MGRREEIRNWAIKKGPERIPQLNLNSSLNIYFSSASNKVPGAMKRRVFRDNVDGWKQCFLKGDPPQKQKARRSSNQGVSLVKELLKIRLLSSRLYHSFTLPRKRTFIYLFRAQRRNLHLNTICRFGHRELARTFSLSTRVHTWNLGKFARSETCTTSQTLLKSFKKWNDKKQLPEKQLIIHS